MEAEPEGEGFHPGRTVGLRCRGGPEGRREPDLDRAAGGVESPEAAHGGGFRCNAETSAAGIRGTGGSSARAVIARMHHRTGGPPWQAEYPIEGRFSFLSGHAEPGAVGVGGLIQITPQLRILVAV